MVMCCLPQGRGTGRRRTERDDQDKPYVCDSKYRIHHSPLGSGGIQVAERLGNRASNQKVAGLIPALKNYVVSLGKALHPT